MQNDMRDRLVELLKEASYYLDEQDFVCNRVADHLIANGAVPVVRCKDCKHIMFSDCYCECSKDYIGIVSPDDYCSYGERKDEK